MASKAHFVTLQINTDAKHAEVVKAVRRALDDADLFSYEIIATTSPKTKRRG